MLHWNRRRSRQWSQHGFKRDSRQNDDGHDIGIGAAAIILMQQPMSTAGMVVIDSVLGLGLSVVMPVTLDGQRVAERMHFAHRSEHRLERHAHHHERQQAVAQEGGQSKG